MVFFHNIVLLMATMLHPVICQWVGSDWSHSEFPVSKKLLHHFVSHGWKCCITMFVISTTDSVVQCFSLNMLFMCMCAQAVMWWFMQACTNANRHIQLTMPSDKWNVVNSVVMSFLSLSSALRVIGTTIQPRFHYYALMLATFWKNCLGFQSDSFCHQLSGMLFRKVSYFICGSFL